MYMFKLSQVSRKGKFVLFPLLMREIKKDKQVCGILIKPASRETRI